ncbi:MAG: hypothetical protein H6550_10750 [Chitinophagales bacterium]|nr:hypothetical protein [Chitinophagales bacterium]
MKPSNMIKTAAIALLMPVLFTACKKDYVCTCDSENALGVSSTETYTLKNQTRIDANDACENFEKDNNWETRNCHL